MADVNKKKTELKDYFFNGRSPFGRINIWTTIRGREREISTRIYRGRKLYIGKELKKKNDCCFFQKQFRPWKHSTSSSEIPIFSRFH